MISQSSSILSIPSAASLVQATIISVPWIVKQFLLDSLSMCPSLDSIETGSLKICTGTSLVA